MEEIAKLIKLIVDQDMEGLQTLEKQISDQVVRLNNTLKSFSITLSTLAECELKTAKNSNLSVINTIVITKNYKRILNFF